MLIEQIDSLNLGLFERAVHACRCASMRLIPRWALITAAEVETEFAHDHHLLAEWRALRPPALRS